MTHIPLLLDDMLQPRHHLLRGQWPEAKPGAAGLQGWDDLGQVVADQTEPGVFSKLLYHWRELVVSVTQFRSSVMHNIIESEQKLLENL